MKKFKVLLITLMSVLTLTVTTGCLPEAKKDEGSTDPGSGDGGSGGTSIPDIMKGRIISMCETMTGSDGSSLNGKTNTIQLTLNEDGTFEYLVWYKGGTGCILSKMADGSDDAFRFTQTGTYKIDSDLTGGSYEMSFNVTAQQALGRNATAFGQGIRTGFNSNCPTLNMPANSYVAVDNVYCGNSNDTGYIPPGFPANNTSYKQVISITNSATNSSVLMGTRSTRWTVGSSQYPTSTETWKVAQ